MMLTTTQTIIICLLRNNLHKDCISIILKNFHLIDVDEIDTSKIPRLFSSYEDVIYLEENVNESMFTNNFKLLLDINFFKEYLIENLKMEPNRINLTDIMIKEKIKIVNLMNKIGCHDSHTIKQRLNTVNSFERLFSGVLVREHQHHYDYGVFYDNLMNMTIVQY